VLHNFIGHDQPIDKLLEAKDSELLSVGYQCGSNVFQGYFDDAKESRVKQRFKNQVSRFKIQEKSRSRFKNQENTQSR